MQLMTHEMVAITAQALGLREERQANAKLAPRAVWTGKNGWQGSFETATGKKRLRLLASM